MPIQLFDFSDWSVITLTGPDRQSYLHSFCTNDIKKLAPGTGCEAFIPTIKGRILGHVLAYAGEESLELIAVPGSNEAIVPHLTKYLLGVDAHVTDRSEGQGSLCLTGSELSTWVEVELGIMLPGEMHQHVDVELCGVHVKLAKSCLTAFENVLIIGSIENLKTVHNALLEKGAVKSSLEEFHVFRIAAGFPWHGVDISEATIAQEAARNAQAISFSKGCYLGQEPIARLDAMGHTNKELRGLSITATNRPAVGDALYSAEKEAGAFTSIAPTSDTTFVALAMVKTKYGSTGNVLSLAPESEDTRAEIVWPV